MIQYAVHMWNVKHTKLLQCFGPYRYESDAQAAIERLQAWPALNEGQWEIVPLYGDPEVSAPVSFPYTPYTPQRWIPIDTTVTWLSGSGMTGGTYQITS